MDRIYGDTPIPDLLKLIKFDDLKQSMLKHDAGNRGEYFLDIDVPGVIGAASRPEPGQHAGAK